MFKKLFAVIAIGAILYSNAHAQNVEAVNARLDAMGGNGVIGDIGWSIDKPCKIYKYADQIQGTGIIKKIEGVGSSFGSIIAIKSLGSQWFVGLTFNDRRIMPASYFKIAQNFGGFHENFAANENTPGKWFPRYPHLNICFKPTDKFSIGIGPFVESSVYEDKFSLDYKYTHVNNNGDTVTTIIPYDSTNYSKYFGWGFSLDAVIPIASLKLNPEIRFFMPSLEGKEESNRGTSVLNFNKLYDVLNPIYALDSSRLATSTDPGKNMFFRIGTKLSGTTGNNTFWIAGLWYRTSRFEIEKSSSKDSLVFVPGPGDTSFQTGSAIYTPAYNLSSIDWWFGLQPTISDRFIFSPEYSGSFFQRKAPPANDSPEDSLQIIFRHKLRLGIEGKFKGFWIFKEFYPRMGLVYMLVRDHYKNNQYMNVDTNLTDFDLQYPWSSDWDMDFPEDGGRGLKITAGFGVKGARGTFDLSFEVLEWQNSALVGPSAALATFGFYFGKKDEEE